MLRARSEVSQFAVSLWVEVLANPHAAVISDHAELIQIVVKKWLDVFIVFSVWFNFLSENWLFCLQIWCFVVFKWEQHSLVAWVIEQRNVLYI